MIIGFRRNYGVAGIILLLAFILFSGCSQNDDSVGNEQVYARVNGVLITESTLRAHIPRDFYDQLTTEHKRKIVEELVQTELLYQEALAERIDKEDEIQRLLMKSKQNLLSNEYLERKLADIKPPNTDELMEYYTQHKDYFTISNTEFRVRYALFDNKDDATDFFRRVKNNESFSELAKELSKHPSSVAGGNLGIVNEDSVEPNIWNMINTIYSKAGIMKISDPFMVIDGWGCVIVDEVYDPGTVKPFEYIRELVTDMYMTEKREESKEELLSRLTTLADIEYEIIK